MTEKKLKVLDLDTPPEITIKPSQVEAHKYGIWCKQLIKEGTKFGPFVGEKAYEVDETMDPAFIWEIVDVETKEFLFYINATNPRYGNWMRHINCARFFEEQNIVSEQEGIDIYYHAIKDIHPGEELLTWYEKSPVRKKKGKKKLFPNVKRARTGDESKVASKSSDYDSVSLRGRRRTARKFWEMEEVGVRTSVVEGQSSSEDDIVDSNTNNDDDDDDEDWDAPKYGAATSNTKSRNSSQAPTAASSAANSVSSGRNSPNVDVSRESSLGMAPQELEKSKNEISASADPTRMYFHFESMVDQGGNGGSHSSTGGSWKNGRRVFRCDICSGVYRHSFSLKRHYVRCHINFKYLTKVDIIQCGVQPPKSVAASQEDMADVDDENITQNSSDGAVTAAASTSSEVPVPPRDGSPFEPHGEHSIFKEIVCSHKGLLMDLYRCNICDQFFDTKEELRYHLSNHPDGEAGGQRQFSCSHCKMQFKHRQNLLRHEVVHTGAKPFSCQQCHKSFPTATNQKRHERIHDGHRLTCDLCPATFTQTGDLKKHASKQHPESYNECAYCSKYFSVESALDAHLRKAHGKDVEANRRRVCVKKKEKKVLLEKDRAESRRLAIEEVEKRHPARGNAEESYACTVCRKCFHNYSNMCRHRRLAHYKDSKVDDFYGMEDEEEVGRVSIPSHQVHSSQQGGHQVGVSTRSSGVVSVELGYKHFLAVARNIPKNLEFFIEGTQQDLNNAKNHIKWKDDSKSHLDRPENDIKEDAHASDESSFTTIPNVSLEDYNFPKGFQITSKANHSASELEPPVVTDNEKSLENEEGCDSKKESEHGPEDDKTFLKLCSVCKMNFADEKGFALHVFSCSSLAEVPPKPKATLTEDVHDYSRKANPEEEAYKVFPELSKLPINLFSGEEILDLSRHKNCIFMSSVDANGMSFPCIAPSEEPLDLTGSKERKILLNVNSTSADCSSVTVKNSSEFKSSTPNKSPTSPILHIKEEVNSPLSQSRSFTNGLVSTQQSTQMINIRPHKKIICLVCYMAFTDKENAIEHQELCHGNVDCRHAEVDEDFEISMLKVPKPVGLLSSSQIVFTGVADKLKDESLQNTEETNEAISKMTAEEHSKEPEVEKDQESLESSLKVDEVDVSTEELLMTVVSEATLMPPDVADLSEDAVVCTKCRLRFTDLCALHSHISESCGDYWRNLSERVSWVFVLRGNLVPPEREQPSGTNQPKKRGKFKWQQNSNPPLFRSNSSNEESLRKQLQSSSRNGTTAANLDAGRKQIGNKVLTRKRSQEIGAAVMSAMEDPDYYVRSKRRAFLQQQNSANASKKGMKRQTSLDLPPKIALTLTEGSDSNQANSSLDEETLANLSGEGFNEDNNDDDDDYDPNKFMCIYCRHQFQYTRTLRKHVLEFCHVRREYVEKGEYLDAEWEDDLNSKVQPPPVVQPVSEVAEENEEVKKSGGRKKKRRSWCSRGCSSNNHKQQPLVSQSHDLSSEVKQYNHLPVQLQLSIDQAQILREAKKDSSSMSEVLLSIPMTTPGGTIVIKADDVHNGESDLLVSCDSIPNEVEDKVGVYKGSYNRAASVVSKAGNLVAASTSSATASVGIRSGDGGFVRSEQPSNATDMPVQFQQTSPQNQETTQYSSSTSHFVIAQDMNSRRFEDDDEEEEDATGLMMTVTSSPAIKQPQDSPWEASGKRSSSELPLVKKRKKLDLGPSTSCMSNSNSQLALDLISKEEKP